MGILCSCIIIVIRNKNDLGISNPIYIWISMCHQNNISIWHDSLIISLEQDIADFTKMGFNWKILFRNSVFVSKKSRIYLFMNSLLYRIMNRYALNCVICIPKSTIFMGKALCKIWVIWVIEFTNSSEW